MKYPNRRATLLNNSYQVGMLIELGEMDEQGKNIKKKKKQKKRQKS